MQSNDFMKISLADINDLNEIMEMYKSCVRGMEKHKITQWDKTYPNKDVIKNDIILKTYYIAKNNNLIVGGVNIDQKEDVAYQNIKWEGSQKESLIVHRLAVRYNFWKQNIGYQLMLHAENLTKEKKMGYIRLDTYYDNKIAMKFYKKLKYKKLGYIYLKPNKYRYYCFEKKIL